jgi:hypothetical protein
MGMAAFGVAYRDLEGKCECKAGSTNGAEEIKRHGLTNCDTSLKWGSSS